MNHCPSPSLSSCEDQSVINLEICHPRLHFKGINHWKMKILPSFMNPHAIPDVYDFLFLVKRLIYASTYNRITVFCLMHVESVYERYYTLHGFKEITDWRNKRWEEHNKDMRRRWNRNTQSLVWRLKNQRERKTWSETLHLLTMSWGKSAKIRRKNNRGTDRESQREAACNG